MADIAMLRSYLADGSKPLAELIASEKPKSLADAAADLLIALNAGDAPAEAPLIRRLLELILAVRSERLRTVCIGTIWREDLPWLAMRIEGKTEAREKLLLQVTSDKPSALPPVFWRAVADRGARYIAIAFDATRTTHPLEAARLLVRKCRAAVNEELEFDIRPEVDRFLGGNDAAVRATFLDEVKKLPQLDKKALMTHLDISLMHELDESAIEARGRSFFYDEVQEKAKREEKSKDIFEEVRRRLEKGEKPQ